VLPLTLTGGSWVNPLLVRGETSGVTTLGDVLFSSHVLPSKSKASEPTGFLAATAAAHFSLQASDADDFGDFGLLDLCSAVGESLGPPYFEMNPFSVLVAVTVIAEDVTLKLLLTTDPSIEAVVAVDFDRVRWSVPILIVLRPPFGGGGGGQPGGGGGGRWIRPETRFLYFSSCWEKVLGLLGFGLP